MPTLNPKEKPVCEYCGSDDVAFDAAVRWNQETQAMEISGIHDSGGCSHCRAEFKSITWVNIDDKNTLGTIQSQGL